MMGTVIHLHEIQRYVYIHEQTAQLERIGSRSSSITLHFGALATKVMLKINNDIEPGIFYIPRRLSDDITIPDLPYDYYIEGTHLFIGPVIGMLVPPGKDRNQQLLRFSRYDQIRGLIFLFDERRINLNKNTIKGYYYDPASKGFIQGRFPYPTVIFNRAPMESEMYNHLRKHGCEQIFNYPFGKSDKWALWEQMSLYSDIKKHLPHTTRYTQVFLEEMVSLYDEVYLKPTRLAGGKGILRINKSTEGYTLTDREGLQLHESSLHRLSVHINRKIRKDQSYIIQQAIPFYHRGSKIDFRVYFQKDLTKCWKYSGMEAKVAYRGSIISNYKNRRKIRPGEVVLKRVFEMDNTRKQRILEVISRICVKVFDNMESNGDHLGDVAVDIVIDRNGKVWILEIQLNYTVESKANRTEDERHILPQILPTPFEYAKALTGFNRKE